MIGQMLSYSLSRVGISWFASASKKLITLNRGLHIILYILDSGVFLNGEATLHWFLINNKGER